MEKNNLRGSVHTGIFEVDKSVWIIDTFWRWIMKQAELLRQISKNKGISQKDLTAGICARPEAP